jgi:BirA family biotin operon repressor/biotin-[acetyl-CoA-carboxylase] ligase
MWRNQIVHYEVVDSTMNAARKRVAAGAGHGTVITAVSQSAGRGRTGQTWLSPRGAGLYFTLIVQPTTHDTLSGFSLMVGAALLQSLHALGATDVQVKWPNDLVVGDAKLGGILVELLPVQPNQPIRVLVGVGINLSPLPPGALARPHVGLWRMIPERPHHALLGDLIDGLQEAYTTWESAGLSPALQVFANHHALAHMPVRAQGAQGQAIFGTVLGIADDGGLRLSTPTGTHTVYAGDVHKVRPTSCAS